MEAEEPGEGGRDLPALLRRFGIYFLVLPALFMLLIKTGDMTERYFFRQDAPAMAISGIALLLLSLVSLPKLRPLAMRPHLLALLLAAFALLFSFAGWWTIFEGYSLSRDELLADFDADILKRGLLIGPIAPAWQGLARAMMAIHMLEVPAEAGWLSGYLPVNALFRAGMDLIVDRSLTSPLLAAVAVVALYGVCRRLWPDRPSLTVLALILLAFSPQFLVTAMTPFAMTGHLALNLLWLWLYLRDRRGSDMAALLVGFFATGLHQIVFHPLFVAPFIAELLMRRRWSRAAIFIAGYAAIGLFWASYWSIALSVSGIVAPIGETGGEAPVLLERMVEAVTANGLTAFPLMMVNLFRFAAWQHILLLPLLVLAWPSIRRDEGIARPLALGMVSMLGIVAILLPWQGIGWGYRYLHGLLGNACLLACYGWMRSDRLTDPNRRRTIFAAASAFTLLVILPFQLVTTESLLRPYREASAFLQRSDADIIIVDASDVEIGHELVRNRPDLSNRPLMIDLGVLTREQLEAMCKRRRFHVFDARHARALGLRGGVPFMPLHKHFRSSGCGIPLPLPRSS